MMFKNYVFFVTVTPCFHYQRLTIQKSMKMGGNVPTKYKKGYISETECTITNRTETYSMLCLINISFHVLLRHTLKLMFHRFNDCEEYGMWIVGITSNNYNPFWNTTEL